VVRSAALGDEKDFNICSQSEGPGQKPGPFDFSCSFFAGTRSTVSTKRREDAMSFLRNPVPVIKWSVLAGSLLRFRTFAPWPLCSAISQIHSFLTKLFHHEKRSARRNIRKEDRQLFFSALQSIGIVHFRKDFLPRMPRMPRMENSLLLIRGIREIRGCISLVAGLPRCGLCDSARTLFCRVGFGCGWPRCGFAFKSSCLIECRRFRR
jgi:hypothetical protein